MSIDKFETPNGSEHLYQASNDEFTNDLFYSDKLNLYEMYNSVKAVSEAAPHLQLESTVESLERKYAEQLAQNESYYLTLSQENYSPQFLLEEQDEVKGELDEPKDPSKEEVK